MKRMFILALTVLILSACGTLTEDGLLFKTADPNLSIGFRLHQPPVPPTPDNPVVPPTATPEPSLMPTPTATPECLIKVNKASNGELIYHVPGSAAYNQTIIEPDKGEFYACDEQAAIDAGARKALR